MHITRKFWRNISNPSLYICLLICGYAGVILINFDPSGSFNFQFDNNVILLLPSHQNHQFQPNQHVLEMISYCSQAVLYTDPFESILNKPSVWFPTTRVFIKQKKELICCNIYEYKINTNIVKRDYMGHVSDIRLYGTWINPFYLSQS